MIIELELRGWFDWFRDGMMARPGRATSSRTTHIGRALSRSGDELHFGVILPLLRVVQLCSRT